MSYLVVLVDSLHGEGRIATYKLPLSLKALCKMAEKVGRLDFYFACLTFVDSLKEVIHADFPEEDFDDEYGDFLEDAVIFVSCKDSTLSPFTQFDKVTLEKWYFDRIRGLSISFERQMTLYTVEIFPAGIVVDSEGCKYFVKKNDLPDVNFYSAEELQNAIMSLVEVSKKNSLAKKFNYSLIAEEIQISPDITIDEVSSLVSSGKDLTARINLDPIQKGVFLARIFQSYLFESRCFCTKVIGNEVESCSGMASSSKFFILMETYNSTYHFYLCNDLVKSVVYFSSDEFFVRYDSYEKVRNLTLEEFIRKQVESMQY